LLACTQHVALHLGMCVWPQDCTARVWEARSGRQVAFFVADAPLTCAAFAGGAGAGGSVACAADILAAGDAGGAVHFLDLPAELQPDGGPLAGY
jgi:hypothetical protein